MKLKDLKSIIKEEVQNVLANEATIDPNNAASEVLSMLSHPDLRKGMEILADRLDDAQYMAIKKHYDALYNEIKKYE